MILQKFRSLLKKKIVKIIKVLGVKVNLSYFFVVGGKIFIRNFNKRGNFRFVGKQ